MSPTARIVTVVFGLLVFSSAGLTLEAARLDFDPVFAPAREQLEHLQLRGHVPGLSFAVAWKGDVVWRKALGWVDAEPNKSMNPAHSLESGASPSH